MAVTVAAAVAAAAADGDLETSVLAGIVLVVDVLVAAVLADDATSLDLIGEAIVMISPIFREIGERLVGSWGFFWLFFLKS